MTLQRIVIDLRAGEMVLRVLYRSQDGPNPGTKARTREVTALAKSGLRDALHALGEGEATMCGTSGYTQAIRQGRIYWSWTLKTQRSPKEGPQRDPAKRLGSAMTTDSWRVRVSVGGAGLWVFEPSHARHAPYKRGG
jgi:hypothetical protein